MKTMDKPKILLIDIETLPNLGYTWQKYEQTVIEFKQEFCIASFAAKWLQEGKVFAKSLPDYKGYKPNSYDDRQLVEDICKLLSEADIVIAHNGDAFDFKVINSRFIFHKITPPAPYKTIDTKKVAKDSARFNSNKLDDLARYFGAGRKIDTTFKLWLDCIAGDKEAWTKMVAYNKHDVVLLEKVYLGLRPYAKQHPNIGAFQTLPGCPKCGSRNQERRGFAITSTRRYQRYQCKDCGGWSRSTIDGERMTEKTVAA